MKCFYGLLVLLFTTQTMANSQYPELLVAPKASERLRIEAVQEGRWSNYLPLQISGATTLIAGLATMGDYDEKQDSEGIGPKLAVAVGASWLAASIWMQMKHRPYARGYHAVRKMPNQSPRDQLAAERMAEEHIDDYARFARKLKWMSFGTNLAASAYAFSSAEEDSAGQGLAALSTLASFLPLLFPLEAEQVSEDQRSYKKKVFGPITFGNGVLINPANQKPTVGLLVGTYF